ncbi:hypothetical protein THIX_60430 [Thiomonas sp. X19]|nr:hypothetical protein THIX_60430 [Thiomonas sp. X19]
MRAVAAASPFEVATMASGDSTSIRLKRPEAHCRRKTTIQRAKHHGKSAHYPE